MDRRAILEAWMAEYDRGPTWVAAQTGWSREMISYVLHVKRPMSDKLARALHEKLGIQFDDLPSAKRPPKRARQAAKAVKN